MVHLCSLSITNDDVYEYDNYIVQDIISSYEITCRSSFLHITISERNFNFSNLQQLIPSTLHYLVVNVQIYHIDFASYLQLTNWITLVSRTQRRLCKIKLDIYANYYESGPTKLETIAKTFRNDFFKIIYQLSMKTLSLQAKDIFNNYFFLL